MVLKRALEFAVSTDEHSNTDDVYEPPAKRQVVTAPATPLPITMRSFPLQTPRRATPYPSHPVDSPTNPVGRKRTKVLVHTLPPPTKFSKHLPLRFQFVRPNLSPRMGGIYRIVQVPLSYTFVQLRCLIAFLFGGGYGDPSEDRHLFELKKKLVMYAQTYRPGQIRSGYTAAKLSTARDPCRYRPEVDEDNVLDDGIEQDKLESDTLSEEEEGEGEDQGWTWQPEEEYTLGHAWPTGGDLACGIIYHHNETTAVHITINTASIPRRSGISNVPHVFNARGRIRLFPNLPSRLPKPVFSVPISKLTLAPLQGLSYSVKSDSSPEQRHTFSSIFGDSDSETDSDEDNEEMDETKDDPNVMITPEVFNAPDAFATYLRFIYQRGRSYYYQPSDDSQSDEEYDTLYSTPGLVHTSSSPGSSPGFLSSDIFPSSPISRHHATLLFDDLSTSSSSLPSALSANECTPAPQHAPWHARRLERLQKRMDKHKKRAWMCTQDEEEEEEVDQLCNDDQSKKPKHTWRRQNKKKKYIERDPSKLPPPWVKPKLKPGEIWDPFGDELEV